MRTHSFKSIRDAARLFKTNRMIPFLQPTSGTPATNRQPRSTLMGAHLDIMRDMNSESEYR